MKDQDKSGELLVKYGFIKKDHKNKYEWDEKKAIYVPKEIKGEPGQISSEHADQERDEENNLSGNSYYKTEYPKPGWRLRLVHESFNLSMEELYFWAINHIRQDQAFPHSIKITDVFSASENSAFFGQSAQRKSIQEDRASGFLRGISELVKTLFQIVRELRNIEERLEPYKQWNKAKEKGDKYSTKSKSADATLKGFFADFAENKGGQMQPGSIYHLSNQVGYATLPDLFFNTVIYDKDNVNKIVDDLEYNTNVKAVLKRKLYQFIIWKEKTEQELEARRKFQIKYLRQHYTVIKTYMGWVKPYLKHIKRLQMNEEQLDSPDLISSFETSSTEIEVLMYRPNHENACNSVVLMTFEFTTRPVMQYRQEYNQGPIHIGRGRMTMRSYGWTDDQIKNYKKMKDDEDRELLGLVDDQLGSAMEMLGDDLDRYLKEAEGTLEEESKEETKDKKKKEKLIKISDEGSVFEPFVALFQGFIDMGGVLVPSSLKKSKKSSSKPSGNPKGAIKGANGAMWQVYNNYKKSHGLLSW